VWPKTWESLPSLRTRGRSHRLRSEGAARRYLASNLGAKPFEGTKFCGKCGKKVEPGQ
jgi:hypothetical protein